MESEKTISTPSDGLSISDGSQRMRALHGRTSGPTRRSTKGQWTAEEDEILRKAVQRFKGKNWKKIAECFKDRTDVQCLHRWQKVLNPELIKGPWSKEEDEIIIELVKKYGPKKWSTIAQHLPGRIGKQCRERWHNHLNPAINKEAWTQEEELALIRAHQVYGNRWAELTKFLPGRTDNAIKNHWNSSVKKKLDSYLASGLLDQFPLVRNQNQPMPSSSSRMQSSADESASKGGIEVEEISECSQDSIRIGSQSASDLANAIVHTRDHFQSTEISNVAMQQDSCTASCSEPYYASLEDVKFSIPEIPCEVSYSSKFAMQSFSHDGGASESGQYQFNLQDLPNMSSLDVQQESSGLPTHCIGASGSDEMVNVPFQTSAGLNDLASMGNMVTGSERQEQVLITDDECCRILFSEAVNNSCFSPGSFKQGSAMVELDGCTNTSLGRSSEIQISEPGRTSTLQSSCPSGSDVLGTSCCQPFSPTPLLLSAEDGAPIYCREASGSFGSSVRDGFIFTNDPSGSPCNDTDNTGLQEQSYHAKDSLKLVPVNAFTSASDAMQSCSSADEKPNLLTEQDTGSLCYEPPRFPSLDIPFFSCDLIPSASDMQQEYSPLGIRQLMLSSNCITPFRLWDSPSRDDSPDAVLKSAAKTFTGTPSILKKRSRDLLSPLSEKRTDKKLETDLTSSLAQDFSRLDVMFDDSGTYKASQPSLSLNPRTNNASSFEDREKVHVSEGEQDNKSDHTASDDKVQKKDFDGTSSQGKIEHETFDSGAKSKINDDSPHYTAQQSSGVLLEHSINDLLLFSPDQICPKADRSLAPSIRTPRNQFYKSSRFISNQGYASEVSVGNPCLVVSSPTVKAKNGDNHFVASTSVQSSTSAPLENSIDNGGNGAGIENYNIFGGTPFKRSIESPSAWKSPWFLNSFIPGPRVDTEISIEDIGYLMSPGDRSYDALGLMKQLSGHTAAAYADALEILGNQTPESLLKERCPNMDKENQPESRSHLAANILTERRVLDFSECGTPGKGTENVKSSSAVVFSSPSSYLLKGCR